MIRKTSAARIVGSLTFLASLAACALRDDGDPPALPNDGVIDAPSLEAEEPDGFPHDVFTEDSPLLDATLKTEWGELKTKYRVVDGEALAEGDIVVPAELGTRSATIVGRRWPNGVIPYVIDGNLPMSERVTQAIAHWESLTRIRFVPRTTEMDYVHFRSANSCSATIGRVGGRQFVNLTTTEGASTVAAIGVNPATNPPSFVYFFKRGYATLGTNRRVNAYRPHFRYVMPPGKAVANLVDVAFASNGHLFAWYDDGTVSEGSAADFALHAPPKPYTLADGKTPADVASLAIDAAGRAHAFYTDGTFSVGSVTDLAATTAPRDFAVAPERQVSDLAFVDFGADDTLHAFYFERVAHPETGATVIRRLFTGSGTATDLASNAPLATVGFPGHCSTASTVHEIGHSVGLFHEQTRHDRDDHVRIVFENVSPNARFNFEKHPASTGVDVGPYDFDSIMHYGPRAFSVNGQPTIVALNGASFGQRSRLSEGDIAGVHTMYP